MTDIDRNQAAQEDASRRRSRHGFWFGIFAGGLLGLVVGGAVAAGAKAHFGSSAHPRRAHFRHHDPEEAREHMELMADWILRGVGADEAQREQAKRVISDAFQDLRPLIEEHRSGHQALVAELTKAELDPDAIERIRARQVELIDQASKDLSASLTELASVLTPEQRLELVEAMGKFRH